MSNFKPDISQLLNAAFGLIPIVYKVETDGQTSTTANFNSIESKPIAEAKKISWMGTPIMFPVQLEGGNYNLYNEDGTLGTVDLNAFDLPPATVVDFRRSKNITKTNLLGANGTVKEIYGLDDWVIRIRGLCLDTPQMSAYEQHQELLKWEPLVDSINIIGELFKDKSIYSMVFEDVDFRQLQGKHNVIPFEITGVSDEPLELVL
jgi:hypothetical protein